MRLVVVRMGSVRCRRSHKENKGILLRLQSWPNGAMRHRHLIDGKKRESGGGGVLSGEQWVVSQLRNLITLSTMTSEIAFGHRWEGEREREARDKCLLVVGDLASSPTEKCPSLPIF